LGKSNRIIHVSSLLQMQGDESRPCSYLLQGFCNAADVPKLALQHKMNNY